jgi:hypothetical protein
VKINDLVAVAKILKTNRPKRGSSTVGERLLWNRILMGIGTNLVPDDDPMALSIFVKTAGGRLR